jgi:uncharacterized protein
MARRKDAPFAPPSGGHPLKRFANAAAVGLLAACAPSSPAQAPTDVLPTPIYRFEGDVQLRNGAALHYSAILVPDPATPNGYLGTIDIPKQAMSGASLQAVLLEPGESVEFGLNTAGHPRWLGAYDTDGTLACEFSQSDERLPCSMRELKTTSAVEPAPPHREQTPAPPFPYATEDVQFVNPLAHVLLSGTLTVPAGAGPYPALIVIGDRGMRDRDGSLSGHRPWLVLADHLARAGIAMLRVEPRRAGERASSDSGIDQTALESDIQAGLGFLRSRERVDARRLGLLGHGYGAPVAARLGNELGVEFIVLLAPPALPGRQVLGLARELAALDAGASAQSASAAREDLLAAMAIIESEPDPARARARLTAFSESLTARQQPGLAPLTLDQMLSLAETPGIRELARLDPAPLLRAIRDPVFALVPALDREVDPAENLPALRAALAQNPDARIETLARLNHRFQTAETGEPAEYEKLPETFAPAALDRIVSWIRQISSR